MEFDNQAARIETGNLMTSSYDNQTDAEQRSLDNLLDRGLLNRLTLIVGHDAQERSQALKGWLDRRDFDVLQIHHPADDGICLKCILDAFIEAGIIEEMPSECADNAGPPTEDACQSILVDLVNRLATVERDLVIVFRDYQPCDDSDRVLTFLLEHLPQHIHLYLCCDDAPGLTCIPRLRVRRQLQTIDTSQS